MKFLITNDDGIDAAGLGALVTAAQGLGESVVVARAGAQSGGPKQGFSTILICRTWVPPRPLQKLSGARSIRTHFRSITTTTKKAVSFSRAIIACASAHPEPMSTYVSTAPSRSPPSGCYSP